MTSAPLRMLVLSAATLTVVMAPSAQARPVDCDGTGVAKCVIASERAPERVEPGRQGLANGTRSPTLHAPVAPSMQTKLAGHAPITAPAAVSVVSDGSAGSLSRDTAPGGDRPYLALLLATVGIVAFMAHRRSGG